MVSPIAKRIIFLVFLLFWGNRFVFAGPTSIPVSITVNMTLSQNTGSFNQFVSIYSQSVSVIDSGPVSFIVRMPFDLFVKGVLLEEMGSGPSENAFEALAVAVRSFTATTKNQYSGTNYDVTDDSGQKYENYFSTEAVAQTRKR
jgi:peptidoglycan hydrolase-like amidase